MVKTILSIISLLLGIVVLIGSTYFYMLNVPKCVANAAGLAAGFPPVVTGIIGGLSVAIYGITTTLRGLPYRLSIIQVVNRLVIAVMLLTFLSAVLALLLSGSFGHMGYHKCTLVPWSP
jgi:hypothetical protein